MDSKFRPSFAFLVLAYNHQDFVLEHLESIRFLVEKYGADYDVDLIINDDFSRDHTCSLIDRWLCCYRSLFRSVETIYNRQNLGTCASINNILQLLRSERCKLTAADDIYSFENIFELTKHDSSVAMISGRVLYLNGSRLRINHFANVTSTATEIIYSKTSLLNRFKHCSYTNAPNLLYAAKCLLNTNVLDYMQRFDVIEDWPLQVAIARHYPRLRLRLIDKVFVYYRRTEGSTYIVASKRYDEDKVRIFDDLIKAETSCFERLRLKSRKHCYLTSSYLVAKLSNLDVYLFCLLCLLHSFKILKTHACLDLRVGRHQQHYEFIRSSAQVLAVNFVDL